MSRDHAWDPDRYLAYADERGRPFVDLVARVAATRPRTVVDLGCGPGTLTALLHERWPEADVLGVRFETGDLRDWSPDRPVDVVVSNAAYQWVPGHLALLASLVEHIAD